MKRKIAILLIFAMTAMFAFASCGSGDSADQETDAGTVTDTDAGAATDADAGAATDTAAVDASVYGYDGDDPVVAAAYKYMAEEVSKSYEKEDVSIPVVIVVGEPEEGDDGDIHLWGDFQVYNYDIDDADDDDADIDDDDDDDDNDIDDNDDDVSILKTESGGDYPGMMHITKADDGTYSVTAFDVVADGGAWESSAKEIFGDKYDAFMEVYSNDATKDAARLEAIRTYVKANGLKVTKYQDEGWDPVEL